MTEHRDNMGIGGYQAPTATPDVPVSAEEDNHLYSQASELLSNMVMIKSHLCVIHLSRLLDMDDYSPALYRRNLHLLIADDDKVRNAFKDFSLYQRHAVAINEEFQHALNKTQSQCMDTYEYRRASDASARDIVLRQFVYNKYSDLYIVLEELRQMQEDLVIIFTNLNWSIDRARRALELYIRSVDVDLRMSAST